MTDATEFFIPFYYDYTCPWAYLGNARVEKFFGAEGIAIDFRPVYLKRMKEPMVGPEPAVERTHGPRKKRYYERLRRNWADALGVEFGDPDRLVAADTALLLRGALVAGDAGRFREYHYPAYRARWVDGDDVSRPEVVHRVMAEAGMDADAGLAAAQSAGLGRRLETGTDEAIALGVFGVPTIVLDGRVIWGNDQFEMALAFARGQKAARAA